MKHKVLSVILSLAMTVSLLSGTGMTVSAEEQTAEVQDSAEVTEEVVNDEVVEDEAEVVEPVITEEPMVTDEGTVEDEVATESDIDEEIDTQDLYAVTASSGTCGDNLTWTLDDVGTLTISGTGNMRNAINGVYSPFYSINSQIKKIVISEGVTSIGKYAFYRCDRLTSITIPNSVTSIGDSAFYDCYRLTSITIPNSVTSIGSEAFESCTGLTSITIPNSVTSIGSEAFEYCDSLTSITIPNSVTSIGKCVFSYCRGLTSITIPNSVTSIGILAFCDCYSLTSITIPNSVTSIEDYAFQYCKSLTSITIPNSVTRIGNSAFGSCDNIADIYYGGSEEKWKTLSKEAEVPSTATVHYNESVSIDSRKEFIQRLYYTCLGREADQEGINYWINYVKETGISGPELARYFIFSNEMFEKELSNSDFVDVLYRALMDREPDTDGKNYWVHVINSTGNKTSAFNNFASSAEFVHICKQYGLGTTVDQTKQINDTVLIKKFIRRFYTKCMERTADEQGVTYWTRVVSEAGNTAPLVEGFMLSPEFKSKNLGKDAFLKVLYHTFFDREPDDGGMEYWRSELGSNSWSEKVKVLQGFMSSEEYKNMCAQCGITPGTLSE